MNEDAEESEARTMRECWLLSLTQPGDGLYMLSSALHVLDLDALKPQFLPSLPR